MKYQRLIYEASATHLRRICIFWYFFYLFLMGIKQCICIFVALFRRPDFELAVANLFALDLCTVLHFMMQLFLERIMYYFVTY